ncbi:hypothetical protein Zmor_007151 [Zophobas morio]|uniref:Uncharacterized protein n=1 Tax=Zophobas morio TaxID=2755281 RepID=A0AA38MNB6_9CUCU|nr:hypothetical protein Zmor_007151 [Zophobas morio]
MKLAHTPPRYDAYASSSIYAFLLVCSLTHRSRECKRKSRGAEKNSRLRHPENSDAAFWIHQEAWGDLNRGHRREPGIHNSDKSGVHLSCEVVIIVSCVNTSYINKLLSFYLRPINYSPVKRNDMKK